MPLNSRLDDMQIIYCPCHSLYLKLVGLPLDGGEQKLDWIKRESQILGLTDRCTVRGHSFFFSIQRKIHSNRVNKGRREREGTRECDKQGMPT